MVADKSKAAVGAETADECVIAERKEGNQPPSGPQTSAGLREATVKDAPVPPARASGRYFPRFVGIEICKPRLGTNVAPLSVAVGRGRLLSNCSSSKVP